MKKTIISLLALTACISANAQTMKIYKGTTLVAEYTLPIRQITSYSPKRTANSQQRRSTYWKSI